MSGLKKIVSVILAAVMLLCITAAAFAETEEDYEPKLDRAAALEKAQAFLAEIQGKSSDEIAEEQGVSAWDVMSPYGTETPPDPAITVTDGQSWEDVVDMLIEKYDVGPDKENSTYSDFSLGYYNTLTGEEKYYNGDTFLISASMMKVPENMIYTDMIYNGEMDWDTEINGYTYSYLQYRSIVHSDNDAFMTLLSGIGGYSGFKEKQIQYLGDDPRELCTMYAVDNYYSAKELVNCLKLVYNEPERFAGILENMLEAEPYSYFKQYERRYPIAQKYGFLPADMQSGHTIINSCGVVFTDTPFIIVAFTDSMSSAYDFIAEYCTLMCDYTNFRTAEQQTSDALAEEQAVEELEERSVEDLLPTAEPVPIDTGELSASETQENSSGNILKKVDISNMSVTSTILLIVIFIATVMSLVLIFRYNASGRINGFWAVVAVLFAGLCLFACVVGCNLGTLYVKTDVDPQETVIKFYQAILDEDYATAYSCLGDYSSLGLENEPDTEEGKLLYNALKDSYSFTLHGDAVKDKLNATQTVAFRYLNLSTLEEAVQKEIDPLLKEYVDSHTRSEIYDANGAYLQSVTDAVYLQALEETLESADKYYTSSEYDVTLTYSDGSYLMYTNSDMLKAFLGGVS